nr:hypothetical protein [Pedobacter sp. HDW13]
MIAASALLCKRSKAILSDLWILRHIWDTEEQREIITNIVDAIILKDDQQNQHPRVNENNQPDAEEIYKEVKLLSSQWAQPEIEPAEKSLIKDRLMHLSNRCEWIGNLEQRKYIKEPIDELWKQIMVTA